jgi:hypothetical protein
MSIHWSFKWSIFAASVLSLSWFFAGWRAVNEHGALQDWGTLAGGTATTLLLLTVQGYWIYFEEKDKGKLMKRVELFEKVRKFISERKQGNKQVISSKDKRQESKEKGVNNE